MDKEEINEHLRKSLDAFNKRFAENLNDELIRTSFEGAPSESAKLAEDYVRIVKVKIAKLEVEVKKWETRAKRLYDESGKPLAQGGFYDFWDEFELANP